MMIGSREVHEMSEYSCTVCRKRKVSWEEVSKCCLKAPKHVEKDKWLEDGRDVDGRFVPKGWAK